MKHRGIGDTLLKGWENGGLYDLPMKIKENLEVHFGEGALYFTIVAFMFGALI